MLRLKEGGTLHTLHQRWWIEKGQCGGDAGSASSKVIPLVLCINFDSCIPSHLIRWFTDVHYSPQCSFTCSVDVWVCVRAFDVRVHIHPSLWCIYLRVCTCMFNCGFVHVYQYAVVLICVYVHLHAHFSLSFSFLFSQQGKTPLTLSNVAGIFYILICGLVLAIILGVFEFQCFRYRNGKVFKNQLVNKIKL